MSRFKFRLEKVLNVRELQEELAKQEWAVQERLNQEKRSKLEQLKLEKKEVIAFGYGHERIELRQAMYDYLLVLNERIDRQTVLVVEQKKRTAAAKEDWLKARQETKKVFTLREKQYAQFITETHRNEQKILDDMRSHLR